MGDAGPERRAVEERGRQYVQRVEPAAGLTDVLDDEVAREVCVEPLLVRERVVHLAIRHRPRIEPDVEDVLDAAHRGLSGGIVRIRPGQFVDIGAMQIFGPRPEIALEFVETAVDVGTRILRVVGDPHRNGRPPVSVSRDRPVPGVRQPLAELPVLDVLGIPGDLLVEGDHPVTELGHLYEPR